MNKKQILVVIFLALVTLNLIYSVIYSFSKYGGDLGKTKEIDGSCYDRYSNEIKGLTCKNKVIDEYDLYLGISISLSMIIIFIGIGVLVYLQ